MALIVLMLLDAFFIGHVRAGLGVNLFGLTDRLGYDWPILTAHFVLFACLLPMSVIDLEYYWVDIRFTNLATLVGFAMHTIWTPKHSMSWPRPYDSSAAVSLFAIAGLAIAGVGFWIWQACRPQTLMQELGEPDPDPDSTTDAAPHKGSRRRMPTVYTPSRVGGWIVVFLLIALFVGLLIDESNTLDLRHPGRALLPLLFFFGLIVWESTIRRPSDQRIAAAIEAERPHARRMVLSELAGFTPVILCGLVGWWVMTRPSELPDRISSALHVATSGGWQPMFGFATAASGYLVAGALGWLVRILFTLLFGKEAFGTGDIHMMAAAGCVAGWPVVVLGFFLACLLAMTGWILALPFKRTRALPLGPWLALSFLTVVVFYDRIVLWPAVDHSVQLFHLLFSQSTQPTTLG